MKKKLNCPHDGAELITIASLFGKEDRLVCLNCHASWLFNDLVDQLNEKLKSIREFMGAGK